MDSTVKACVHAQSSSKGLAAHRWSTVRTSTTPLACFNTALQTHTHTVTCSHHIHADRSSVVSVVTHLQSPTLAAISVFPRSNSAVIQAPLDSPLRRQGVSHWRSHCTTRKEGVDEKDLTAALQYGRLAPSLLLRTSSKACDSAWAMVAGVTSSVSSRVFAKSTKCLGNVLTRCSAHLYPPWPSHITAHHHSSPSTPIHASQQSAAQRTDEGCVNREPNAGMFAKVRHY